MYLKLDESEIESFSEVQCSDKKQAFINLRINNVMKMLKQRIDFQSYICD